MGFTPKTEVSNETTPKKESNSIPRVSPRPNSVSSHSRNNSSSMSSRIEALTIKEDAKEDEPEEDIGQTYPYERLKISSPDPVSDIDVTKREVYVWFYIKNVLLILDMFNAIMFLFITIRIRLKFILCDLYGCRLTCLLRSSGRSLECPKTLSTSCPSGNKTSIR